MHCVDGPWEMSTPSPDFPDSMVGWYVLDRKVQFQGGETIGTDEEPVRRIEVGWTGLKFDSKAVYRVMIGGLP
jgi:hypothetical protein